MLPPIYVIDSLLSSCEFPVQTDEMNIDKKSSFFYLQCFVPEAKRGSIRSSGKLSGRRTFVLKNRTFETMSKRAWTDVLLQMYKVNCRYICYQILRNWWLKALFRKRFLFWKRRFIFSKHIFKTKCLLLFYFFSNRERKRRVRIF